MKVDGGWRDENEYEAAGNRDIKSVISDSSNNI